MDSINGIRSADGFDDAMPHGEPFQIDGATTHFLRSTITDDLYRIDIAIPNGTAPEAGWPAIFLLDAAGCFATCVEAMRRMSRRPDATGVVAAVVIGISLAQDNDSDGIARRRRDFTSSVPDHTAGGETGGAASFLSFILQAVAPLIQQHAAVDPARRTLFGHSLAGYFTLWVLAHHPHSFLSYAAISPSIWWDQAGLMAGLAGADTQDRRAMIAIGEWEDTLPPWQQLAPGSDQVVARRAARRMIGNARDMGHHLRRLLGPNHARFDLLPDEDHASIISAAIPRMLRMASRP